MTDCVTTEPIRHIVQCLVLPLLHHSLTDPTHSATPDQGKYCGQRRCQTGNCDHVEVWYLRNWTWKKLLMWYMPLNSLTLIVWNFPGNLGAIFWDSIPGKNAIFPGSNPSAWLTFWDIWCQFFVGFFRLHCWFFPINIIYFAVPEKALFENDHKQAY